MTEEQEQNLTAWLQALHEENKRLNKQVKHLNEVVEVIGLGLTKCKQEAEQATFRLTIICLIQIVTFLAGVALWVGFGG